MPEARSHALWLLAAFSALEPADVLRALKDEDARIRRNALQMSEPFLNRSKPVADAALAAAADPEPRVRFQSALTIGYLNDGRTLPTLAQLAHAESSDPWFRLAILSSAAGSASSFYHMVLAKGESWTDPALLSGLSALIGAREVSSELAAWFAAMPKLA